MKIAFVLAMPSPYHNPVFERLSKKYGDDFLVIFMTKKEPNRLWKFNEFKFNHIFLKENYKEKTNKNDTTYRHNNFDIFDKLIKFNPDIVITRSYNLTPLYAWLYTIIFRKKHIAHTDGWRESEKHLSLLHRIIRKIVYKTSKAFIAASINSENLFLSYGVNKDSIFKSHLCIVNERFYNNNSFEHRKYDLMFSGRFVDGKMPLFFVDVIVKISEKIPNLKVLILGDGPLKEIFLNRLKEKNIDYNYVGFVQQDQLPQYYANSKLFLFPTKLDCWGLVANEAMASGTPVISTPYSGIVNDLLINETNGYIIDIDSMNWSKKALNLLENKLLWEKFSKNAKNMVSNINFDSTTQGIIDACEYVSTTSKGK